MRKLALLLVVIGLLALVVAFYHSPLDWWQTHHMDIVNRGEFLQADCLYCHDPATSCNNCHGYVGVAAIVE
jgi:hypothetical protein